MPKFEFKSDIKMHLEKYVKEKTLKAIQTAYAIV